MQDRVRLLVRRRDAPHGHQPLNQKSSMMRVNNNNKLPNRPAKHPPNRYHHISNNKQSSQIITGDETSDSIEADSDGVDLVEHSSRLGQSTKTASGRRKQQAPRRRPGQNRQRQKLIHESLSRSRQTTSMSTFIKYLTPTTPQVASTHAPTETTRSVPTNPTATESTSSSEPALLDERKRTNTDHPRGLMSTTATLLLNRMNSGIGVGTQTTKAYVNCPSAENTCLNGGVCYISNPMLYADSFLYNQVKIKFCM